MFMPERERLARMILEAPWQKRENGYMDSRLMEAAQYKANDMVARDYFSHTSPTGETPNAYVRAHDYILPNWYPQVGNNVESIYAGFYDPNRVLDTWLNSPPHRKHVTGEESFYAGQRAVGVGLAIESDGGNFWVFISAPVET
jgi:uncharacterized protein YkwD